MFSSADYREAFVKYKEEGKKYDDGKSDGTALNHFMAALQTDSLITDRNDNDERAAAFVCTRIAIIYFNLNMYGEAAKYYNSVTLFLNKIKLLLDKDYRFLIDNYVGLAGASARINRNDDADQAFTKAIESLHKIYSTTPEEKTVIQNAIHGDQYVSFRQLIEKQTGGAKYLKSADYQSYEQKFSDRLNDNGLISQFNAISFGTGTIGMFGTQQQSAVTQHELLWGQTPQPNNTNDDNWQNPDDLGMKLC
jgi:tetratricopeptide (TPR) repeat protein